MPPKIDVAFVNIVHMSSVVLRMTMVPNVEQDYILLLGIVFYIL